MSRAESVPPLHWPLLLLPDLARPPLEHLQPDQEDQERHTFPHQTGPEHTEIAARLPEVGAYLGAQWASETLYKVDGGQAERSLLWRGDVRDEGGNPHAEGDVAAGQSHREVDREEEILLGPRHEGGVEHEAAGVDHAEEEVGVEKPLATKGVAPAAQEEGADDREDVINNTLIHLELSYFVLDVSVGHRVSILQQVVADVIPEGEVVDTSFINDQLVLTDSVNGSDDAVEQHDRFKCDVGEEVLDLPLRHGETSLLLENDFRYLRFFFLTSRDVILHFIWLLMISMIADCVIGQLDLK